MTTDVDNLETEEKPWTLTIRLPRELETAVRRLARERLVQPSVVVRQLVKERLDELEPGQVKS